MKVKIIKGTPIYLYKGTQYLEKPDKCKIKSMDYNADENITYVKCTKNNYIYEFICIVIILMLVFYNNFIYQKPIINFQYNSVVQYYKGDLYLNLRSDDTNKYDITVKLKHDDEVISTMIISPGNTIVTVGVEDVKEHYVLELSCKYLLREVNEEVPITVVKKD